MDTFLYAMTFLPMLLITLVIHEGGHFLAARTLGLKANGFQIGVGPRIWSGQRGKSVYTIPQNPQTPIPLPKRGDQILIRIEDDPTGRNAHQMADWTPLAKGQRTERALAMGHQGPTFPATVKKIETDSITVSDTTVTIAVIPLMAMVYLPEDPTNQNRGFINTAPWVSRITTILAGVGANVALLTVTIFIMAIAPIARPGQEVVTIASTIPGSPAHQAGLLTNDAVMKTTGHTWPTGPQFIQSIADSHKNAEPLDLTLQRRGQILSVSITPDPATGQIGVNLQKGVIAGDKGTNVADRFWHLSEIYFTSLAALVQTPEPSADPQVDERRFTGMISAAQYTGQAVQTAKLKAWFAILGVITLSMAAINLLPIPPLDGFQLVTHTVKSLRKGKDLDPKVEHALALTGISLLAGLATYLAVEDIIKISGG